MQPDRRVLPAGVELPARAGRAPVAEDVRLVEEDHHSAVAQRLLAQLAVEPLDLHRGDADEGLHEGRRIDEDVRLAGLARHRLGHERLARARGPPQEDAARHVAALGLDLGRLLQEVDVLLHLVQHRVLAPDVPEAGLDLARLVGLHAPDHEDAEEDQQVEQAVHGRDDQREEQGQADHGVDEQNVEDAPGRLRDGLPERGAPLPGQDQPRDDGEDDPLEEAIEAVAAPRVHLVHAPVPAAPDPLLPELVVGGAVLADHVVDLPEDLEEEQGDQPPLSPELVLQGLPEGHDRDLRVQVRGGQREEQGDQHEDLEPVPQHHREPGLRLPVVDLRLVHRLRGRRRGRQGHAHRVLRSWPLGPFAALTCVLRSWPLGPFAALTCVLRSWSLGPFASLISRPSMRWRSR